MADRIQCEFYLLRYVPDAVKNEFVNIGVMLREAGRTDTTQVRFTPRLEPRALHGPRR